MCILVKMDEWMDGWMDEVERDAVLPLLVPLLRLAALRLAAARRLGLLRQLVDALLEELEAVGRVRRGRPLRRVRVGRVVIVVVDGGSLVLEFISRVAGLSEESADSKPVDPARQLIECRVSNRGRGEFGGLESSVLVLNCQRECPCREGRGGRGRVV